MHATGRETLAMQTFEWTIILLLAAIALASLARRVGAPYPTFLAFGGAALAFVPEAPVWTLDPGLALALFVAPVLLDAAYDTSLRDLRDNWLPVASLAVVAVGITTVAVAVLARWLVPEMSWPVAIALGAIVAPPDAAAATTVIRQVGLPHRITKILEGESLLNDASALLVYRLAVGAALAGSFEIADVAPAFLLAVVGSLIVGPALGWVVVRMLARVEDAPSAIILQFCTTFGLWLLAEHLGLSAILTIVTYAMTVALTAPMRTPARIRVPSYAVWESAVFVLNALAFVLIGLQLRPIFERLDPALRLEYGAFALMVLVTVILVRIAWVMAYNSATRARIARFGFRGRHGMAAPTRAGGMVISWAGMRGIVTLAAAFALPETLPGGAPFPHRDLALLTAFCVVLGTLSLQGLTLRWLIGRIDLTDDDPVGQEVARARAAAYRAALEAIDGDQSEEGQGLRREYQALLARADDDPNGVGLRGLPADPLRQRAIEAARRKAAALRDIGEIGDDAFHILEEELDWAELSSRPAGPSSASRAS
jgi:CPA1 family monovalent cation:H+ antiporter